MYSKISTADMCHEEWRKLRQSGIGGSDAGAVCGVNPYSSPMKVYRDKTEELEEETQKEAVRIGRDLEDYVAQRFMEATGLKVRRSNYMYRSKEHPFMIADVDRLIISEDAGLECKTTSAYNADKWKDGNIPIHYVLQCYHYMAVTGKKAWYIAAVILGQGFVYYKLEWNDTIISQLISTEERFWNDHVIPRVKPAPDGSDVCGEILNEYFHIAKKDSSIELSEEFDEKLNYREELIRQIEALTVEKNRIEQEVKLFMGEHENAESDYFKVSWSNVESNRLDSSRLKKERPDIYQKFVKTISTRRMQIKVRKDGREGDVNGKGFDKAA